MTSTKDGAVPEPELIGRIVRGERHLFHDLVRPYERAVYVTTLAVLRNHADAEEAAQETFVKALTHLSRLEDRRKFKPWLMHIALNEARLKRRGQHAVLFEPIDDGVSDENGMFMPRDFADWRDIPSETLEKKEIRNLIATALHGLPPLYREVFVLRDIEQLSTAHCAETLGISEQAVKVRLHRARLQIREELAPIFRRSWFARLVSIKGRKPW